MQTYEAHTTYHYSQQNELSHIHEPVYTKDINIILLKQTQICRYILDLATRY